MTGDGERTKEAWLRVGRLLKRRRAQLDPRYRVRRIFAEEKGFSDKTIQEVEKAYRTSFTEEMVTSLETAYLLPVGSISQVLDDPSLTDFPGKLDSPAAAPRRPSTSTDDIVFIPEGLVLAQLEPWVAHLWQTPQLSIEDREMLIEIQQRILDARSRSGSTQSS